ncbi:MAG: hypothetical protein AB7T37_10620 [Dehalococcoidia bacterium]
MTATWDYRIEHHMDLAKGLARLHEAGPDGWELVNVLQPRETVGYAFVLKRALPAGDAS